MAAPSDLRAHAGRALLAATSGALLVSAVTHDLADAPAAALLASAAVLLGRKSATAQVVGRGLTWAVVLPSAFATALGLLHGFLPGIVFTAVGVTSALALWLTRDALRDESFAPHAFRRGFFGAASLAMGFGVSLAWYVLELLALPYPVHAPGAAVIAALAAMLIATGIGVSRMRAWGVAVGATASVAALASAVALPYEGALAFAAAPGAFLVGLVLLARARRVETRADAPRIRVAEEVRVVAAASSSEDDEVIDDGRRLEARSTLPR